MRRNRFFVVAVALTLAIYGALGFYALPLAHFEGDLTRMAPLPEPLFGWTRAQPMVTPQALQQVPLAEADVLVIGDSFSVHRVWQSALLQKGLRVHTEEWGSMPYICADLGEKIRRAGFQGKWIVIESVERNLPARLQDSLHCYNAHFQQPALPADTAEAPPIRVARDAPDYSGRLLVGLNTLANGLLFPYLQEHLGAMPFLLTPEVALRPVPDGCRLFSHPACTHALFYGPETGADNWQEQIASIQALNARLPGFGLLWLVIPNKTTAYFHPNKQLWRELHARKLGPDMLSLTSAALRKQTVDLYPGNNTHVSTEGYLMIGQAVAEALQ